MHMYVPNTEASTKTNIKCFHVCTCHTHTHVYNVGSSESLDSYY